MNDVPQLAIGALALALVVLGGIGVMALGVRLNRRGIRRGSIPYRGIPWFLGGVPDAPVDPPREASRSDETKRG